MWIRRDQEKENKERITLLLDAFATFTRICDRDGIDSFAAYDGKYMVHYHAETWIASLRNLIKKYKNKIPKEQYVTLECVSQTLDRMESKPAQ
jgi:hypothetical protein